MEVGYVRGHKHLEGCMGRILSICRPSIYSTRMRVLMPDGSVHRLSATQAWYVPLPHEIDASCQKIQKAWSPSQRMRNAGLNSLAQRLGITTIPIVRDELGVSELEFGKGIWI